MKVKVRRQQEVVVGGWAPGEGRRAGVMGSLLAGYYEADPAAPSADPARVGTAADTTGADPPAMDATLDADAATAVTAAGPDGQRAGRRLCYAGRVGSGLTDHELTRLGAVLAPLASDVCPFDPPPPALIAREAHWVRPEVVVEVAFGHWTDEGRMRHPVYLGQRIDTDPAAVVREPSL